MFEIKLVVVSLPATKNCCNMPSCSSSVSSSPSILALAISQLRAKDELFARRRIAALGAAERVAADATSARVGLLALGSAAAVAGAFAVTKRARRWVGSDAERVPLIADRV